MSYTVITLSGVVASGKSAIADQLAVLLPGWTHFNTGQRFRDFCESQGMSIQQVSQVTDNVHIAFDRYQSNLMRQGERLVVEGRLAGWLARGLPHAFRVLCTAPLEVRAGRYMDRQGVSHEQAIEDIEYRDSRDVLKFHKIYAIEDYRSPQFYHLVLDTTQDTPEALARRVLEAAQILPTHPGSVQR